MRGQAANFARRAGFLAGDQRGFSLPEMLIGVVLAGMLGVGVSEVMLMNARNHAFQNERAEFENLKKQLSGLVSSERTCTPSFNTSTSPPLTLPVQFVNGAPSPQASPVTQEVLQMYNGAIKPFGPNPTMLIRKNTRFGSLTISSINLDKVTELQGKGRGGYLRVLTHLRVVTAPSTALSAGGIAIPGGAYFFGSRTLEDAIPLVLELRLGTNPDSDPPVLASCMSAGSLSLTGEKMPNCVFKPNTKGEILSVSTGDGAPTGTTICRPLE